MPLGYLDGNTGSLLATVLVGGTAGAAVAMRSARARVTGALSRKRKSGGADPEAEVAPADSDPAPPGA